MSAATSQNESLTDAVALLAVCKGSVALMEVALALQMVASGVTEVPEEARKNRIFARVHRRLTSPAWIAAARAALGNEGLARVAACFRAGCFEYATPKTPAFYDDEEWLRGIQLYYLLEENMRVLGDMIVELMRLPEVDVEPRQAPAAKAQATQAPPPARVAEPVSAPPVSPPRIEAPPAEWAIPIALIAIGKADRNPLWVSFGATVGCLSGFWNHEPKLAADPQFSVAAKTMLATPRGFEMASALLHDPALRATSQAMMMRWRVVTGGSVASDGLHEVKGIDAELAILVGAVLRAMNAVVQTFVKPNPAATTVANEPPSKPSLVESSKPASKAALTPRRVNIIRPPALRFVPMFATPERAPRAHIVRDTQRVRGPRFFAMPKVMPYACRLPQPRSRSPPGAKDPVRYDRKLRKLDAFSHDGCGDARRQPIRPPVLRASFAARVRGRRLRRHGLLARIVPRRL